MNTTLGVKGQARGRRVSVGTRYPLERRKLLEVIQVRRGDAHLSDTITAALEEFIARHFSDSAMRRTPSMDDRAGAGTPGDPTKGDQ